MVAELVGAGPAPVKSLIGALKGEIAIAEDFDQLPDDLLGALDAPIEPQELDA